MTRPPLSPFQTSMAEAYDRFFHALDLYFEDHTDEGFADLGLFLPGTRSHAEACTAMVERLLTLIPVKRGRILDVGCGMGGPAARIARHYPPDQVYGINISEFQLESCRRRVPGGHFRLMPAERMDFPDGMFDAVIAVESAPHFQGRREFLAEARRVLKPGGDLVVGDLLFQAQPQVFQKVLAGQECYRDLGQYRDLWGSCGFPDLTLEDVTGPVLKGFVQFIRAQALRNRITGRIDGPAFRRLLRFAARHEGLPVLAYVLAHASRPA